MLRAPRAVSPPAKILPNPDGWVIPFRRVSAAKPALVEGQGACVVTGMVYRQ